MIRIAGAKVVGARTPQDVVLVDMMDDSPRGLLAETLVVAGVPGTQFPKCMIQGGLEDSPRHARWSLIHVGAGAGGSQIQPDPILVDSRGDFE